MNIDKIDRRLQVGINVAFLVLAFFLPLLVSTRSSEVFELPKMLFGYAAAAAIVGLWLSRMVLRREILIRRTPLDIPILLFLISQMVSTIYSIDPHVSWWGWYGRFHGGLWSTISYTLLYYALVANISIRQSDKRTNGQIDKQINRQINSPFIHLSDNPIIRSSGSRGSRSFPSVLIFAILFSAAIVSVYAILQHFGIDKDFWVQDVVNRVFSTQGQPNWLAGYIVMILPLAWMLTIADFKIVSGKRKLIAILLYCYIAILFLALLWTKSRSGLLGLAVADAVFWTMILWSRIAKADDNYIDDKRSLKNYIVIRTINTVKIKKLFRLPAIAGDLYSLFNKDGGKTSLKSHFILIHILMTGLILATNNPAREWMVGKLQATSNRRQETRGPAPEGEITLRKSEHGGTESEDIRRIVWNGSLQLVKQRPISGFGPETFGETYWRVRPKEHNLTSEWNFLYNKAHNEWLNLAANTGLFGLGSHLLLLVWLGIWSISQIISRRLSVFGYQFSVTGSSVFSLPVMKPIDRKPTDHKLKTENRGQITGLLIAVLAALIGVEAVNFFGFSTVTVGVYRYLFMAAAVSAVTNDVKKLLNSPPDRQDSSVIKTVSKLLKPIADRAVCSVISDRYRDKDKNRNLRKNMDLWQKLMLAALSFLILYLISQLSIFFLADLAYNRGRAYQDAGYIEEAVEPLMRAVNLAPGEPVFRAELAEAEGTAAALLLRQRTENGERRTENLGIQRPGLPPEVQALSEIITQLKNNSIANFEIVRRQSPQNLGFIRTQAKVMFLLGSCSVEQRDSSNDGSPQCEQALQLMKLAIAMAPTNPQLPYSLGLMLTKMGQEEEAAVYFMKALELKPDLAEATEKL